MNESWTSQSTRKDSIRDAVMIKSITEYDYVKLIEEDSRDDHKIISEESRSQIMNILDESRGKLGDSISFKRSSFKSNIRSEEKIRSSVVYRSKGDILTELVENDVMPEDCHNMDNHFEENVRFSIDKEEKSIFKKSTQVCSNSPNSNQRFTDSFNKEKTIMEESPLNFDNEIKFQKVTIKKMKMKSIDAYIQSSEKKSLIDEPQMTKSPAPVMSQVKTISNEDDNIAETLRKRSEYLRKKTRRDDENPRTGNGNATSRSRKSNSKSRLSSSRSRLSQTSKLLSYDIIKSNHYKTPYSKRPDKGDDNMLKKMVKHTVEKVLNKQHVPNLNFKRRNYYEWLKSTSKANLELKGRNYLNKKKTGASPRVMSMIKKNFMSKSQRGNSYERKGSLSRRSGKSRKKKRSKSKRDSKVTYTGVPTGFTRSLITRSYRELARKRIFNEKTRSLSKRLKARTKSSISQRVNSRSSAGKNLFRNRKISQNDSNSIRIHSANLIDTLQASGHKKSHDLGKIEAGLGLSQNKQFKELITKMYQERSPSNGKNDYEYPQTARSRISHSKTGKKKHRKTSSKLCGSNAKSKRKGSRLLGNSSKVKKKVKSKTKNKGSVDLRAKKKSLTSKPLNLNLINSKNPAQKGGFFQTSNLTFKNFGSGVLSKNIKNLDFNKILKKKMMASPDLRKNKIRQKSRGNSRNQSSNKKFDSTVFKNSYLISHLQKINKKKYE